MEITKKNRKKYMFTCTAPKELTDYNKNWNVKIFSKCRRTPLNKYQPDLNQCLGCEFLEVKGY